MSVQAVVRDVDDPFDEIKVDITYTGGSSSGRVPVERNGDTYQGTFELGFDSRVPVTVTITARAVDGAGNSANSTTTVVWQPSCPSSPVVIG